MAGPPQYTSTSPGINPKTGLPYPTSGGQAAAPTNPMDNRATTVEVYNPAAAPGGQIDSTVIAPPGAAGNGYYDYGASRVGNKNRTGDGMGTDLLKNIAVNSGRQADLYWDNYGQQASTDLQREQQQYQDLIGQQAAYSQQAGAQIAQQQADAGYAFGDQSAAVGQQMAQYQANEAWRMGDQASNFGQQQAGSLAGLGQTAVNAGLGQATALQNVGASAANSGNFYGNQLRNMGNSQQQAGADAQGRQLANYNEGAGDQYGYQASLNAQALGGLEAQQGPSAAQAQLASATNRNQSQALAMARSGRGWGGSATALGQASVQAAQAGQEAGNQSAMLRAQEDAAWRQRQASNLNTGASIYQQGKGLEMTQQQQAAQVALQQAQINDQRQVQMQGLAGQNMGAAGGLAQQGYGQQLAAQQAAAGAVQQGYGQQIGAQQAAAEAGLSGITSGGQLMNQGLAGASQSALSGIQGGGALAQQGLQGASQSALAGAGQAGQLYSGAQQGSLATEAMQGQIEGAYQGYEQGYQNQLLQAYGIEAGLAVQQANMGNQLIAAGIGAAGGAAGMMSDRDKKKNIEPANKEMFIPADTLTPTGAYDYNASIIPAIEQQPVIQGAADPYAQGVGISGPNQAVSTAGASSDASEAARARAVGMNQPPGPNYGKIASGALKGAAAAFGAQQGDPATNPVTGKSWGNPFQGRIGLSDEREKEAIEAIGETPGYSYDYKDPDAMGAAPGRQFGVMAQDLEKTPAGRSTVREQPDGTKMVDTSRLTMVNTAALNALERKVAEIDKRYGKVKAA